MYESYYQLATDPFRLSPDRRFSFQHSSYIKAKAYMRYALKRAEGFVMITGRPGSGKTTLVDDLLASIESRYTVVARLVTTQVGANDLLRMVAYGFDLKVEGLDKATLIQRLKEFLVQEHVANHKTLLVIDEAQALEGDAMEEMRLLTNLQLNFQPLLQVFLIGQEKLLGLIQHPTFAQLHQRMIAASHLESMTEQETKDYIIHRLRVAGWHQDPQLTVGALRRMHMFSGGVPRLINQLGSRLLLFGAMEEKHTLTSADVQAVIEELRQEQLVSELDREPAPGTLDADDEVIVKRLNKCERQSMSAIPSVVPRAVTQHGKDKCLNPAPVVPQRYSGGDSALAEDILEHGEAVVEALAQPQAKPRSTPQLALVQGGVAQARNDSDTDTVRASQRENSPDRWSLSGKDSKQGFATIAIVTASLLVGGVLLMSKHTTSTLTEGGVAAAHARVPHQRMGIALLHERIATKLAGKVRISDGDAPSQMRLRINDGIQFNLGEEAMTPTMLATLSALITVLHDFPQAKIRVLGYCDQSGSEQRNKTLSTRRAQVVAGFMAEHGIAADRLSIEGRGSGELQNETRPEVNRRVEFSIGL